MKVSPLLVKGREGKNGFGKGGGCRERLDNMFLLCSPLRQDKSS